MACTPAMRPACRGEGRRAAPWQLVSGCSYPQQGRQCEARGHVHKHTRPPLHTHSREPTHPVQLHPLQDLGHPRLAQRALSLPRCQQLHTLLQQRTAAEACGGEE